MVWIGVLIAFCSTAFFGAVIHTIWNLSLGAIVLTMVCVAATTVIGLVIIAQPSFGSEEQGQSIFAYVGFRNALMGLMAMSFIGIVLLLLRYATVEAINTPWHALPSVFWVLVGVLLASATVLIAIVRVRSERDLILYGYIPGSLCVFVSISLTIFLYPLGYGFDPFIHQATERLIIDAGVVTPKPLYYMGQYAVVVITHYVTQLPVAFIDRLLLPFLATMYLFPFIAMSLRRFTEHEYAMRHILLASFFILAWPLGYFVMTTPHGLSSLMSILSLFWLFGTRGAVTMGDWFIVVVLALGATAIHPLPGLAILVFLALYRCAVITHPRLRQGCVIGLAIFLALAYPIAFAIQGRMLRAPLILRDVGTAIDSFLGSVTVPQVPFTYAVITDFIYTYGLNVYWIFLGLAMFGWYTLKKKSTAHASCFLIGGGALFVSGILLHFLGFSFLISYQQLDFHARITEAAWYFLFPLCALGVARLISRVSGGRSRFHVLFFSCVALGVLTINIYLSYPRNDAFTRGHGYNLSIHDLNAVDRIAEDAKGIPYAVLANQMMSVAALSRSGFSPYYDTPAGLLYRYPIPTTHPLYDDYLDMVYEAPTREVAVRAMNTMGVNRVYFALDDYWSNARDIIAAAKPTADRRIDINKGKVVIFVYDRRTGE